jgi:hypothetical protein
MSCLRLNSKESYEKSHTIFHKICDEKSQKASRIAHPYALLASLQGHETEAFEVVSQVARKSVIRTGLLITLLTNMGRFSDAIGQLEAVLNEMEIQDSAIKSTGKIIFSIETIEKLTQDVEKSEDKILQVRLASIFNRLDKVASISEKNLMDTVASPIDVTRGMKYKREKNKYLRQQRQTMMASEDIDVKEAEEVTAEETRKSLSD